MAATISPRENCKNAIIAFYKINKSRRDKLHKNEFVYKGRTVNIVDYHYRIRTWYKEGLLSSIYIQDLITVGFDFGTPKSKKTTKSKNLTPAAKAYLAFMLTEAYTGEEPPGYVIHVDGVSYKARSGREQLRRMYKAGTLDTATLKKCRKFGFALTPKATQRRLAIRSGARRSIPSRYAAALASLPKKRKRCAYCNKYVSERGRSVKDGHYQIDHFIPFFITKAHHPDNLYMACVPCNRSKSGKLYEVPEPKYSPSAAEALLLVK
jgi:hypothetical protein